MKKLEIFLVVTCLLAIALFLCGCRICVIPCYGLTDVEKVKGWDRCWTDVDERRNCEVAVMYGDR